MTRGEIDGYTEFVEIYGAKGLAWIKVNDVGQGPRRPADRRSSRTCTTPRWPRCCERTGAADGDLIFFGADKAKVVNDAIGALRVKIGQASSARSHGLFEDTLGAAVGGRLPDVRVRRGGRALDAPCTIRSPRRRTATRT